MIIKLCVEGIPRTTIAVAWSFFTFHLTRSYREVRQKRGTYYKKILFHTFPVTLSILHFQFSSMYSNTIKMIECILCITKIFKYENLVKKCYKTKWDTKMLLRTNYEAHYHGNMPLDEHLIITTSVMFQPLKQTNLQPEKSRYKRFHHYSVV